jgi:hypothetical protein
METVLPSLLKEASNSFPTTLAALHDWRPPWQAVPSAPAAAVVQTVQVERTPQESAVHALLAAHPASVDALARLLGVEPVWAAMGSPIAAGAADVAILSPSESGAHELLLQYPQAADALGALLGQ